MRCAEYGAAMLQLFSEVYSCTLYATCLKFGNMSQIMQLQDAQHAFSVRYLSMNDSGCCMFG